MSALTPIEALEAEHRVIQKVVAGMVVLAEKIEGGEDLHVSLLENIVEFLRTFADRCHHGKEENQLFVALEKRGFPRHVGPMAVMLDEHEIGRRAIQEMRNALVDGGLDPAAAARRFHRAATGYVELLRDHIAKEDGVLFPMAESVLGEAEKAAVLAAFEKAERDDLGAGVHQRMLQLADELADRFRVPKGAARPQSAMSGGCCHGHGGCH